MNNTLSRSLTTALAVAALAAPLAFAGPAAAQGGKGAVRSSGHCVGGGSFELKAKHDDGRIELEYEIDTNRAGQAWHVRITDNGGAVVSRTVSTTRPSGSFTVHRLIADRVGADSITARATFGSRSCGGHVTL